MVEFSFIDHVKVMSRLNEGDELRNGAFVQDAVLVSEYPNGDPRTSIVLCWFKGEFVVCLYMHVSEDVLHGKYHQSYIDALRSYAKKIHWHTRYEPESSALPLVTGQH